MRIISLALAGALALLLVSSNAGYASVDSIDRVGATATVSAPSVALHTGTAGTSSISSVEVNAATATVTAGLKLYETSNAPTSCSSPTVDTSVTAPGGTGSFTLSSGQTACLWSPQYGSGVTTPIQTGTCVLDLWASDTTKTAMAVTIYATNSAGTVQGTLESGNTAKIPVSESEVTTSFTSCSGTVPAGGYIEVTMAVTVSTTIYWGAGQLTNFQTPSDYNYVLKANNLASVTWSVSLATESGMTSNLGRLSSLTISINPSSTQIVVSGGLLTQTSGSVVTLASAGSAQIHVVASANVVPTNANVPSTITFSLRITSASSTAFALYTITLTVD